MPKQCGGSKNLDFKLYHYQILGVDVNAHENVVIDRYLELAKLNHPDHGGSNEKMAEINQAYQEFRKKDLRD